MKVGIRHISESEQQVHIGCAYIRLDRFSLELLNVSLENALTKDSSVHLLESYIKLGMKINELDDQGIQRLLREVDSEDIEALLIAANDASFTQKVLKNIGGLLLKQIEQDMKQGMRPTEEQIKKSVRRLASKLFELEQKGELEFFNEYTQYI